MVSYACVTSHLIGCSAHFQLACHHHSCRQLAEQVVLQFIFLNPLFFISQGFMKLHQLS